MKERLVKGHHVRGLLDLLGARGRLETLPELAPPGADLVRKTVYPTTWYQLRAFDGLLQSVHRYVFDGSEAAGQQIGRLLAARTLQEENRACSAGDANDGRLAVGELLARYWKTHFNFAATEYEEASPEAGVRIRITGFPDMSASHGHVWMGWCTAVFENACDKKVQLRVEERPWMHNSVLTYTLTLEDPQP